MIHFLTYNPQSELCEYTRFDTLYQRHIIERWIRAVAAQYSFSIGELTYIFCDDEKILEVNRAFLGHDYYTDVITFDYTCPGCLSGDIYISTDTVKSNADSIKVDFTEELLRIIIHGVLHLTGQNDKTPETKAEMTQKENLALSKLTTYFDTTSHTKNT